MAGTLKNSQIGSSKKRIDDLKRLVLLDREGLIDKTFKSEIQADAVFRDYQIVAASGIDDLLQILRQGDVDVLLAAETEPKDLFPVLELARQISPRTPRILVAKVWNEEFLRESMNRAHVFRALRWPLTAAQLKSHLHTAAVEADLARSQTRLMREASKQNRELETLTSGLEKIVEERTLHIRQSKEEMDEKLDRVRNIIHLIKDLSQNISFEELMDIIRRDFRKYAKLGEPILIIRADNNTVEILSRQHTSAKADWPFPKDMVLQDKNLGLALANHFGRPFVRLLSIPLEVRLIQKFGFAAAAAVLCVESSMSENEQAAFLDHIAEILRPISMAVDRAFLENELSMQSFRWEKTFDGLRDPIAIIDGTYQVLRSNNKFSERLVQRKCHDVFAGRPAPCEGCPQKEALQSHQTQTGQIRVGEKIYEVRSYPIQMGHGVSSTTVVNQYVDVTQSRQLYLRMLQSEKMGALGLLAGNIAHELNNPLSGIRSLAQVMMAAAKESVQIQGDLKEIEKAAARSQAIIKDLLDFSTGTQRELRQISFSEIVQRTMPLMKTLLRNHKYHLDAGENEAKIEVDPQLMQHVVFNLVNNACQAMKDGGNLTLSTGISEDGHSAWLSVKDTGPGIPEELLEKIFEPFYTTKKEDQGTGLGLSLSRDIVRRFNGDVQVRSRTGEGSEFIVRVPISTKNPGQSS